MKELQTIDESQYELGVCVRTVRSLLIPIVRIGRRRLYDPRDVSRYIEASKCLSSSDRTHRITTRSSLSKSVGRTAGSARSAAKTPNTWHQHGLGCEKEIRH